MSQAWLQVAGLVLDFLGFALIAWEWLIAQRAERAQRAIEARHARDMEMSRLMQRHSQSMNPHASPHMQTHHQVWDDMRTKAASRAIETAREDYARMRYGVVFTGMAFVVIGFALQVAGTIPGCCAALGVVPGGG